MPLIFSLITVGAMVYALVDLIMRDESQIKHLPKFGWILLVVFLPLIGTILWFVLGREYTPRSAGLGGFAPAGRAPEQPYVPPMPSDPRSTEEQIADLDREIEFYQKRAELEQRKRELGAGGDAA